MNNRRSLLFAGLLLILIGLSALFYSNRKKKGFDWRPTYEATSKDPYGTFVIASLLKNYFPGKGFNTLQDSIKGALPLESTDANYVFVGEALFMDSLEMQLLLEFVENGNTAFISSRTIPYDLLFYIYEECEENTWEDYAIIIDSSVQLNLEEPVLKTKKDFPYEFIHRGRLRNYDWSYIDKSYFCEEAFSLQALGSLNDSLINFAKVRYGEGTFYLHTTPLAFSNIAMLDSLHLAYANRVFSYLPPGRIYWDEYSKTSDEIGRRRNNSSRALSKESPLQYVLSQPPLAWAWYLLLAIGLLYLLFRTKRRQRVIPVLEPNVNTSLAFVSTIGRLYFLQNSHKKLALQKMKLLLNFVRERYRLRGSETEAEFIQKLTAKSEVPRTLIDKIWLMYANISRSNLVTENTLIEFHQLMEEFYKKAK